MPTTSSFGRYSSYTSSYPSYRSPAYTINRTTSLDRSAYNNLPSNYSTSGYYSKRLNTLPPRPSYYAIDAYRSSRTRVSPVRSSYSNRLISDSSVYDKDPKRYLPNRYRETSDSRESPYSSHENVYNSRDSSQNNSRDSGYTKYRDRDSASYNYSRDSDYNSRDSSYNSSRDSTFNSRDSTYKTRDSACKSYESSYKPREASNKASDSSTYSSRYTTRDRSYDNEPLSRRGSFAKSVVDSDDEEKVVVSDRIRSFEVKAVDPTEARLALRRLRLGLAPQREGKSKSPRISSLEDNRHRTEENGNNLEVSDLCKKYDSNLNLSNGHDSESSGCSGGDASAIPKILRGDDVGVEIPEIRKRDKSPALSSSPKFSSYRTKSPSTTIESNSALKTVNGRLNDTGRSYELEKDSLSLRIRSRQDRVRERIAKRLASEVEDGDSPPTRRRSPTGSSSDSSFSEGNGLVGLRNIGNTCFLNSITQCLSNTQCLMEYLVREGYNSDINLTLSTMKGDLIKAFSSLLSDMWREGNSDTHTALNTGSFKSQIQRFAPVFIGYAQHDAQEFLRKLLEGLHEDVNRVSVRPRPITDDIDDSLDDNQKAIESWKRYLRYDDSKIVNMFVGQLKSSLQCSVCQHKSVTFDPFWDLSLPIPSRTGQVKLTQCLDLFTKEEVLDGDERPTCAKCKERRKMTKSFNIQKFPKVLVLHLKRFSPHERWRGKLSCLVDYPLDSLDLSRYSACSSISSHYRLIGVANHSGTALSGHYTAYCKHPYLKTWHEYNDSRVSSISQSRVCSAEAYVLFYELL